MIGKIFYHWHSLFIIIPCIHQQSKLFFFQKRANILKETCFKLRWFGRLAIEDFVGHMATIHNELKFQLQQAQDHYKKYIDVRCRVQPTFKVGYQVWLLQRNIQTTRLSKKLDY